MSDKPEKEFLEKTGLLHGSDCPRTKKEFGQEGGGECPGETLVKEIYAAVKKAIPFEHDHSPNSGPTKVNSRNYRDGHDRIFGTKPSVGQA
jgi:hypothetical protein